jgi:hypothetical protein
MTLNPSWAFCTCPWLPPLVWGLFRVLQSQHHPLNVVGDTEIQKDIKNEETSRDSFDLSASQFTNVPLSPFHIERGSTGGGASESDTAVTEQYLTVMHDPNGTTTSQGFFQRQIRTSLPPK